MMEGAKVNPLGSPSYKGIQSSPVRENQLITTTGRVTAATIFQGSHKPVQITEVEVEGKKCFLVTLLNLEDQITFEPPKEYTPPKQGYPCGV